jgi:hypothetical protein
MEEKKQLMQQSLSRYLSLGFITMENFMFLQQKIKDAFTPSDYELIFLFFSQAEERYKLQVRNNELSSMISDLKMQLEQAMYRPVIYIDKSQSRK